MNHPGELDYDSIARDYGKTFARALQRHEILGSGANGAVLASQADPGRVLKIQVGGHGGKRSFFDEVDATAKAGELGLAPEIYSVETFPDGTNVIEMERVPMNTHVVTREKDLRVAQSQLDMLNFGVTHKDVHNDNVSYDPSTGKVKFVDFGAGTIRPSPVPLATERSSAIQRGLQSIGSTDEAEIFRGLAHELLGLHRSSQDPVKKSRTMETLVDLLDQGETIVQSAGNAELARPFHSLERGAYPNAWKEGRFRAPSLPRTQAGIGATNADARPGMAASPRRAFDMPEALRQAGQEPATGGIQAANQAADAFAKDRLKAMRAIKFGAPGVGALSGLADPEAAELLGAALRQEGPMRTGLLRDAARTLGQNTVVGAVQGGVISGAMAAAPYLGLAPQAAAAATGLTVAAPALAGAAVVNTVDGYLRGATGAGLATHTRRVQSKAQPSGMTAAQQLFPAPRAVVARTPSGTARLTRTRPTNPALQEARNRAALFRQRFNPLRGEFGLSELLLGR